MSSKEVRPESFRLSLFALRRREPGLARPFVVPGYPAVPLLALALVLLSLGTIIYYHPGLSVAFAAGLVLAVSSAKLLLRATGLPGAKTEV